MILAIRPKLSHLLPISGNNATQQLRGKLRPETKLETRIVSYETTG